MSIRLQLLIACSCLCLGIATVGCDRTSSEQTVEQAKQEGNQILSALSEFRQKTGNLPKTLDELDLRSSKEFSWKYSIFDNQNFEIAAGNYAFDGWTLYWNSRHPAWLLDH